MNTVHNSDLHRARVIQAAGEVFGEVGFRAATIREIVRRAGVGLGAIHYHFQDKADLYRAVCDHALAVSLVSYQKAVDGVKDPELKLRQWLSVFLYDALSDARPPWHGRVVLRGMTQPEPEVKPVIEALVKPHHDLLLNIIRELLGPGASRDAVFEHALVLIGQCFVHYHLRDLVTHLRGKAYGSADMLKLRDRLERIVLGAIEAERKHIAATQRKGAGAKRKKSQ